MGYDFQLMGVSVIVSFLEGGLIRETYRDGLNIFVYLESGFKRVLMFHMLGLLITLLPNTSHILKSVLGLMIYFNMHVTIIMQFF